VALGFVAATSASELLQQHAGDTLPQVLEWSTAVPESRQIEDQLESSGDDDQPEFVRELLASGMGFYQSGDDVLVDPDDLPA